MKTLEKVKEKIAKLIALCQDPSASQGEIDNSIRLATKIMAKFNITRDDIDMNCLDPAKKVKMGRCMVSAMNTKEIRWEGQVAMFCCKFIGSCSCYSTSSVMIEGGKETPIDILFFYGSRNESEMAADTFRKIREVIANNAKMKYKSYTNLDGRSYAEGYVVGLYDSLDLQMKQLKDDPETHGLILQSEQASLIIQDKSKEWLSSEYNINLQQKRLRSVKQNNETKAKGIIDGRNHSLNQKLQ